MNDSFQATGLFATIFKARSSVLLLPTGRAMFYRYMPAHSD